MTSSIPALPLDLFRIGVGTVSLFYFLNLISEVPDFSNPDGLIDHALVRDIYWYTKINFLQPEVASPPLIYTVLGLACFGSCWGIILGYNTKIWAGLLAMIVAAVYRWNFIITCVEDTVSQILLVWLCLLPVGHTLTLGEWLRDGDAVIDRWLKTKVSGGRLALRCFIGNTCVVYLVAGLWKFESKLWRDGTAVFTILQMSVAKYPALATPWLLPFHRVGNYCALILEPLLPVLLLQKRGHPLKWLGLLAQIGFHMFILLTMKIPYANAAMLATPVLFFRDELMDGLNAWHKAAFTQTVPKRSSTVTYKQSSLSNRLAVGLLSLICLQQTRRLPILGITNKPATYALWAVGIVQEYQLFNWIDHKNVNLKFPAHIIQTNGEHLSTMVDLAPKSLHGTVLLTYLADVVWIPTPAERRNALKRSIMTRSADRLCRRTPDVFDMTVSRQVTKVSGSVQLTFGSFMMQFQCQDGRLASIETFLDREEEDATAVTKQPPTLLSTATLWNSTPSEDPMEYPAWVEGCPSSILPAEHLGYPATATCDDMTTNTVTLN